MPKINQKLIQQLREGKIAVENNRSRKELNHVLNNAGFRNSVLADGGSIYYFANPRHPDFWVCNDETSLVVVPVQDFFEPEEESQEIDFDKIKEGDKGLSNSKLPKLVDISTSKYPSTYAIVDEEDFEKVNQYKWFFDSTGYAKRSKHINLGKNQYSTKGEFMHRFIMNPPNGMIIDHKDGNKLNNQKSNLRICTQTQNMKNIGISKRNKSGYKGVSLDKTRNKWVVRVKTSGNYKYLGRFDSKEYAVEIYNSFVLKTFGEFAQPNIKKHIPAETIEVEGKKYLKSDIEKLTPVK